ncbi:hypothetical protein AOLI_G00257110 [Acnodon oligacanthus]
MSHLLPGAFSSTTTTSRTSTPSASSFLPLLMPLALRLLFNSLSPESIKAARRLVARLVRVQWVSREQNPNPRHVPADCETVQASPRLQRLPLFLHRPVKQLGALVKAPDAPLQDLHTGDGLRHAWTDSCEHNLPTQTFCRGWSTCFRFLWSSGTFHRHLPLHAA